MTPSATGASARLHAALLLTGIAVLAWSGYRPKDYFTWILEVAPAIIAGVVLIALYARFRFTDLVYTLILVHAIILMIGGHYTYAEMPLFSWLRDEFGLARNYYDRVGHVAQGFVPALIAREILLRNRVVNGRRWLFFVVCCVALAISALYEFLEWWVALASGTAAGVRHPGDVIRSGACAVARAAQLLLNRWHDVKLSGSRLSASGG
jgi:putative membrane protein